MDAKLDELLILLRGIAHEIAMADRYTTASTVRENAARDYIEERADLIVANIDEYRKSTAGEAMRAALEKALEP